MDLGYYFIVYIHVIRHVSLVLRRHAYSLSVYCYVHIHTIAIFCSMFSVNKTIEIEFEIQFYGNTLC